MNSGSEAIPILPRSRLRKRPGTGTPFLRTTGSRPRRPRCPEGARGRSRKRRTRGPVPSPRPPRAGIPKPQRRSPPTPGPPYGSPKAPGGSRRLLGPTAFGPRSGFPRTRAAPPLRRSGEPWAPVASVFPSSPSAPSEAPHPFPRPPAPRDPAPPRRSAGRRNLGPRSPEACRRPRPELPPPERVGQKRRQRPAPDQDAPSRGDPFPVEGGGAGPLRVERVLDHLQKRRGDGLADLSREHRFPLGHLRGEKRGSKHLEKICRHPVFQDRGDTTGGQGAAGEDA